MQAERLQKIISKVGITSRRKAETLILQGRVSVNGRVVDELGAKAVLGKDEICLDGKVIKGRPEKVVVALFKPRSCVTSLHDPRGRRTVADLLSSFPLRVYPVGRLDYDSEGLLLLTNDGELSHRLQHPRYQIPKTYLVKVRGLPSEEALTRLQRGVALEDGISAPAEVTLVQDDKRRAWLTLNVTEGRKRQVRRMCEAVGHPVLRLRRTKFGPVDLGDLRPGQSRRLRAREMRALRQAVGLDE
jgi:pseudouridine synthase